MNGETPERRRDDPRIAELAAHVSSLTDATVNLSGAVTKLVPDQIRLGIADLRRLLLQIGAMFVVLFVAIIVYSQITVGHLNAKVERGHDVILCFTALAEGTRTDAALIDCKEAAK